MIARVSRARVKPGQEKVFEEFLRTDAVPFMKKQKGLVDFAFGWSQQHAGEMVFTSWWHSLDDVKRFGGKDWQKSVVLPGEAQMVREMLCEHYETLAAR